MKRVLVCGGRDYTNAVYMARVLDAANKALDISIIIHGGAAGADSLAGDWARHNNILTLVFKANWKQHGKVAGHIRNLKMLTDGKPDLVIAFAGGKGTAHMRKIARRNNIQVMNVAT